MHTNREVDDHQHHHHSTSTGTTTHIHTSTGMDRRLINMVSQAVDEEDGQDRRTIGMLQQAQGQQLQQQLLQQSRHSSHSSTSASSLDINPSLLSIAQEINSSLFAPQGSSSSLSQPQQHQQHQQQQSAAMRSSSVPIFPLSAPASSASGISAGLTGSTNAVPGFLTAPPPVPLYSHEDSTVPATNTTDATATDTAATANHGDTKATVDVDNALANLPRSPSALAVLLEETRSQRGRKSDPRMAQAVVAKLTSPEMSLQNALVAGGFVFAPSIGPDGVQRLADQDGITLILRKNNLCGSVRRAKERLKIAPVSGKGSSKGTALASSSKSSKKKGKSQSSGAKKKSKKGKKKKKASPSSNANATSSSTVSLSNLVQPTGDIINDDGVPMASSFQPGNTMFAEYLKMNDAAASAPVAAAHPGMPGISMSNTTRSSAGTSGLQQARLLQQLQQQNNANMADSSQSFLQQSLLDRLGTSDASSLAMSQPHQASQAAFFPVSSSFNASSNNMTPNALNMAPSAAMAAQLQHGLQLAQYSQGQQQAQPSAASSIFSNTNVAAPSVPAPGRISDERDSFYEAIQGLGMPSSTHLGAAGTSSLGMLAGGQASAKNATWASFGNLGQMGSLPSSNGSLPSVKPSGAGVRGYESNVQSSDAATDAAADITKNRNASFSHPNPPPSLPQQQGSI